LSGLRRWAFPSSATGRLGSRPSGAPTRATSSSGASPTQKRSRPSCALTIGSATGAASWSPTRSLPPSNWTPELHERLLADALAAADRRRVRGKEVTPFLLEHIVRSSGGASLTVNLDLVENNVRVAGDIARAWCAAGDQR
jgi:hypothetical protein